MKMKEMFTGLVTKAQSVRENADKKVIGAKCKVLSAVSVATAVMLPAGTAKAADDYSFLTNTDNGTFQGLTDTAKATGGSLYKLLMVIGVIGLAASLIFCGFRIAISKSGQKRDENKGNLVWICIGGIIIFGSMTIIGLIKTFAANL